MRPKQENAPIRLAELIAALSIATDLGMGQPMEYALCSCVLAVRLGEKLGLSEEELYEVYYQALLRYMIGLAEGVDLVTLRLGKLVEPLHAVYARDCLPAIEAMLAAGELSVNKLFSRVRVRYVETEEIDRFDPEHLSFFNINTAADLSRASGIARKETENDQC